ncbi:TIGR00266 family protein [Pleurocapsa sp. PCC 7319]|uniref:TIGR00266 family protein n=1 Tax=Pleurocapsa sp. PCC 7319 TaxID=118161 RepID=UPI00034543A1|nr:TIGR00266 family protein [Pleurocapsa sp. PCC 7319]
MEVELLHQPDSAIARIQLDAGEEIIAEAGSMIAMSDALQVNTTMRQGRRGGGIMGGLKRMIAGESLFLSQFRSYQDGNEIWLAPKLIGDLLVYDMEGQDLIVQATSYLACSSKVDLDLGFEGIKSVFSGESIFWLTLSGYGKAILTSFGGIYAIPVDGEYTVDTGHIVAFERTLDFNVTKASSSWIGSFLGGEGLVCRFRGQGKVYCQTHSVSAFGSIIGSLLPAR